MKTLRFKSKSILFKAILIFLTFFVVISTLPFAIPLSKATKFSIATPKPYDNSAYYVFDETYIHYRIFKPTTSTLNRENNKNLLLIHGFGGSSYSFESSVPALVEAGYSVVLVDLPGFGYSSRTPAENHAQTHRATLLWAMLNSLESTGLWHIVGHSMGAGTAAAMAVQEPLKTASLTFVDGALFEPPSNPIGLTQYPPFVRWVQVALEYFVVSENNIESMLTSAYGTAPTREQILGYYLPLTKEGTAKSAATLLKTTKALSEKELSTIRLPILAIWGTNDTWVPLEQSERLKELLPQLMLKTIDGAGHCPMETHTQAFTRLLIEHLNGQY